MHVNLYGDNITQWAFKIDCQQCEFPMTRYRSAKNKTKTGISPMKGQKLTAFRPSDR